MITKQPSSVLCTDPCLLSTGHSTAMDQCSASLALSIAVEALSTGLKQRLGIPHIFGISSRQNACSSPLSASVSYSCVGGPSKSLTAPCFLKLCCNNTEIVCVSAVHVVRSLLALALHTAYLDQGSACLQGDKEKELGMTVSPLMDRKNKGGITRSPI